MIFFVFSLCRFGNFPNRGAITLCMCNKEKLPIGFEMEIKEQEEEEEEEQEKLQQFDKFNIDN